jgi:hypothetical protein
MQCSGAAAVAWVRRGVCACVLLGLFGQRTEAQVVLGADITFATRSVWRGLVRASDPVLQPSAYAALRVGSGFLTAGAWADYEFGNTEPGDHSFAGVGRSGFGAVEGWVEYAARHAVFDWRAGYVHSRFRNDERVAGIPADLETGEVYAGVRSRFLPVALALTAWQDIDALKGTYVEVDAAYPLPTNPLGTIVGSIFVGGRMGLSRGLDRDGDDASRPWYFDNSGLTHAELYAEWGFDVPFKWLPVDLFVSAHHEFAIDDATRRTGPALDSETRRRFWWFEVAASLSLDTAQRSSQ